MLGTRNFRTGALLAPVLVAVALAWITAAPAQVASPVSSGNSFGGGFSGFKGSSGFGNASGSNFTGSSFTGSSFAGSSFSGGFGQSGSTTGSTFSGSSGMNSANRGGFSGNWAGSFSGGSNRGTSAGILGTSGGYGSGATGAGAGSAFSPYYFNPLAAGAPNVTSPTFTSPIYGGTTTGGAQGGLGLGGFPGNFPSQANLPPGNTATGPNTLSRRTSNYTASPGFDYRPAGPSQVQGAVEQVLARSTSLSPSRNIRVAVEGPAVVLRGTVASEQDRRVAEALIRLTPGVFDVRNELEVPGTVSQAGRGP